MMSTRSSQLSSAIRRRTPRWKTAARKPPPDKARASLGLSRADALSISSLFAASPTGLLAGSFGFAERCRRPSREREATNQVSPAGPPGVVNSSRQNDLHNAEILAAKQVR